MKIFKYPLMLTDIQKIKMPMNYKIIAFKMQGTIPTIWAIVDDQAPARYVTIIIKGTGHDISEDDLSYVGTVLDGNLVWHLFHKTGYEINAD